MEMWSSPRATLARDWAWTPPKEVSCPILVLGIYWVQNLRIHRIQYLRIQREQHYGRPEWVYCSDNASGVPCIWNQHNGSSHWRLHPPLDSLVSRHAKYYCHYRHQRISLIIKNTRILFLFTRITSKV